MPVITNTTLIALNSSYLSQPIPPIAPDFFDSTHPKLGNNDFNKPVRENYLYENEQQHEKNVELLSRKFHSIINNNLLNPCEKVSRVWLLAHELRSDYLTGDLTLNTHNAIMPLINEYLAKHEKHLSQVTKTPTTFFQHNKRGFSKAISSIESTKYPEKLVELIKIKCPERQLETAQLKRRLIDIINMAREQYPEHIDLVLGHFLSNIWVLPKKEFCLSLGINSLTPSSKLPAGEFKALQNGKGLVNVLCDSLIKKEAGFILRTLIHEFRHALWRGVYQTLDDKNKLYPYYPDEPEQLETYKELYMLGIERILDAESLLDKQILTGKQAQALQQYKAMAENLVAMRINVLLEPEELENYEADEEYELGSVNGINYGKVKVVEIISNGPKRGILVDMLEKDRALIVYARSLAGFIMPEKYPSVLAQNYPKPLHMPESDTMRYQLFSPQINEFFFRELNEYQQGITNLVKIKLEQSDCSIMDSFRP